MVNLKNIFILNIQANQSVYGKKPAVVDLLIGFLPATQSVMLLFQYLLNELFAVVYGIHCFLNQLPGSFVF